jgi:hypothetical protein
MSDAEGTITEAEELNLYDRLSKYLTIPGRLDLAIVALEIDAKLLSPDFAPAKLARIIRDELLLKDPPQLARLAKLLDEWDGSHPPRPLTLTPQPPAPQFSRAEKIGILRQQIVMVLIIAYLCLAAFGPWLGRGAIEVAVLGSVPTFLAIVAVFSFSKISQAPKSIPEAQFIVQTHQGRLEYVTKGLLAQSDGRRAE